MLTAQLAGRFVGADFKPAQATPLLAFYFVFLPFTFCFLLFY
jgi:hypothetical protein